MCHAVDGVAAPVAAIRTAARGNQGDGPLSVMLPPSCQIALHVDALAIGPRLSVKILNQRR